MAKKTLEEKIKDVGFWTVIFLVLYLIIGYLLESLWLSKPLRLNELYDLLKDGLGITAAFLAPVAAFILFSDWREQHIEKLLEYESTEIYTIYVEIIDTWEKFRFEVEDDDIFMQSTIESRETQHFSLLDKVEKLAQLTKQLQSRDIKAEEFAELALRCLKDIRHLTLELSILSSFKEKQLNPQKYNVEYTNESDSEFASRMELNYEGMQEQMMTGFRNVYQNKEKLFLLSSNLKIHN